MPNTIHVSASANASIANGSTSNPYATIQAAINAAQNGDTILLGDGTYKGVGNRDLSLSGKSVTLLSRNGPSKTIVDAERAGSLFTITGNETDGSKIQGFTFKNGYLAHGGDWTSKALFTVQTHANVRVEDCVFKGNEAIATYITSGLQLILEDGTGKLVLDNVLIDSNKIGGGYLPAREWMVYAGGNAVIVSGGVDLINTSVINNTITNPFSSNGTSWPVSLTAGSSVVNSVVYGNSPSSVPYSGWSPTMSGWLTADIKIAHDGDKGSFLGNGTVTNSVVGGTILAKTIQNVFTGSPQSHPDLGYVDQYDSGSASDIIQSSVTYTLQTGEKHLVLTGADAINGTGNELDNSITGNTAANLLDGRAGNDTLQSGGGNDTLIGGDGSDLLVAGTTPNNLSFISRGDSTYVIVSGPTWEEAEANAVKLGGHLVTINDADENQWLFETFRISGGQWNTLNNYWAGFNDLKQEGAWEWSSGEKSTYSNWGDGEPNGPDDFLVLGRYEDKWNDSTYEAVKGIAEIKLSSAVSGLDGNNSLSGGAGNDSLLGASGNDTLDGGTGADSLVGGAGDDLYVVDNAADAITEIANEGTDTVRSSISRTLGANFENLELIGAAAINATGNASANILTGNAAANQLNGGAGADTLRGGAGNDTYTVDNAGDVIIEAANAGTDVVQSAGSYVLGTNVENLTLIGSSAINGTGNALANAITGNAAANRISAGAGNDVILGGAGNDTLNAGVGIDTVKGEAGSDLLQIDWSSLSGATITRTVRKDGTGTTASFSGSYVAKNASGAVLSSVTFDTIEKLTLNGQSVDLENAVAAPGVTIKRASTTTATTEQGGTVQYSIVLDKAPFEDVVLNFSSSDTTEGKVNTPSLTFTPQNWNTPQALTIQGVDDYLDDSNVAYTITGKVVTADLTYNRVLIPAINLLNNDDGQDNDRIIYGTDETDYLNGANGKDRIYGKGGQDQLKGGIGDDRVYGDQDNDRLFGELGNDKLYGGYDDDTLDGGVGSDSLYGEQGLDTLLGGDGNDYLDGGIENDSMSGGAGNDTYLVDSAGDKINDLGATSDVDVVQVIQTISYTLPANIENAAITASGNGNLTGNTLNNGLTGNDGKNILDGGTGNDSLSGGAGADSLLGGVGNDALLGGAGNDTMRGGDGVDLADFTAAGVDISIDLTTGRAKGDGTDLLFDIENILAGDGDDTLAGSATANDLDGGAGFDTLNGGAGNDTMAGCFFGANGGRGERDTLVGGAGNDIFQLGWSSGRFYDDGNTANAGRTDYILITDFTVGQDKLQLDGAASGYYLAASGVSGVTGTGLYAEQGATDELIAIIRSANTTALNAANTVNTALFV